MKQYTAWPEIERVACDRDDPRLKPRAGLRFWYLALEAGTESRKELLDFWVAATGKERKYLERVLREGDGSWWTLSRGKVAVRTPETLHAELGLTARSQARYAESLGKQTSDWNRHLAEEGLAAFDVGDGTDLVTYQQVADQCGLSRSTVRRHLRRSSRVRAVEQWVRVEERATAPLLELWQRKLTSAYLRAIPRQDGLYRRLPNRYLWTNGPPLTPGWRASGLVRLIRKAGWVPLPHRTPHREIWSPASRA